MVSASLGLQGSAAAAMVHRRCFTVSANCSNLSIDSVDPRGMATGHGVLAGGSFTVEEDTGVFIHGQASSEVAFVPSNLGTDLCRWKVPGCCLESEGKCCGRLRAECTRIGLMQNELGRLQKSTWNVYVDYGDLGNLERVQSSDLPTSIDNIDSLKPTLN